jgi:calcineurin-like phosphoesterase family protein
MTTFFTSDTHFGHTNILQYEPVTRKAFDTVEEMDAELIRSWQMQVRPSDVVYHLGDFAFADDKRIASILDQLPGQKFLIYGNHDHKIRKNKDLQKKFGWCRDIEEAKVDGQRVVLCHFPMLVWNKAQYGAFMLHGHCHGNLHYPFSAKILDVGVDNVGFAPISMNNIREYMEHKPINVIDHHTPDGRLVNIN